MFFLLIKQKTADEMRISDWSSDVCSSDLLIGEILIASAILRVLLIGDHVDVFRLLFGLQSIEQRLVGLFAPVSPRLGDAARRQGRQLHIQRQDRTRVV